MSTPTIRSSQMITTYGPGAIIESPSGPGVMRGLETSGIYDHVAARDYEIPDERLFRRLNRRVIRIPTNAELGKPTAEGVYLADAFPQWSLCVKHSVIYRHSESTGGCPKCEGAVRWDYFKARSETIRYVQVCRNGHLDDIAWTRVVRHAGAGSSCNPRYLLWQGGGEAARNVSIACPNCRSSTGLTDIYRRGLPCTGRYPEYGTVKNDCDERAQIIQRNASNLRMPSIVTSLTIPPVATPLHGILSSASMSPLVAAMSIESAETLVKSEFVIQLDRMVQRNFLHQSVVDEISRYPESELRASVLDNIRSQESDTDPDRFRTDEVSSLKNAAQYGAPPENARDRDRTWFEVDPNSFRIESKIGRPAIRVTPIKRLRVVMAQTGYRRIDPAATVVPVSFSDGDNQWLPGVEVYGEGLFFDFPQGQGEIIDTGEAYQNWIEMWRGSSLEIAENNEIGSNVLHPRTVWWHSLAHRLIVALSIDSGYSSAALRERIMPGADGNDGPTDGGILIYTSQPGGDGTMGGLISSIEHIESALDRAFAGIIECSNDPICSEQMVSPGAVNGAACYACLFTSETSCELRNMFLDRSTVLETLS